MAEGWEKLYRKITETWLWDDKPFARGQAFTDLMLMVNHTENKIFFDGEAITIKRGQRITSLRQLSERWGWSRTKVVKFLETLKNDGKIEYMSDKKKTLITIVNSDLYDNEEATEMTVKSHRNDTEMTVKSHRNDSEMTLKDTNKNEKNDNNDKNEEEGEEKTSHSTLDGQDRNSIENKIFDIVGEVAFETWFKQCDIYETDKNIVIKPYNELTEVTIRKRYLERLNALLNKNILLEEREEVKMG